MRRTIEIRDRERRRLAPATGARLLGPQTLHDDPEPRRRERSSTTEKPPESSVDGGFLEREASRRLRVGVALALVGALACGIGIYEVVTGSPPPQQKSPAPEPKTVIIEGEDGNAPSVRTSDSAADGEKRADLGSLDPRPDGTTERSPKPSTPEEPAPEHRAPGETVAELVDVVQPTKRNDEDRLERAMDRAIDDAQTDSGDDSQSNRETTDRSEPRAAPAADPEPGAAAEGPDSVSAGGMVGTQGARSAEVERASSSDSKTEALSDRAIRKGMQEIGETVATCHRRQFRRGVPLEVGKLYLSVRVQPSGRVRDLEVRPRSLSGTILARCLESRSPRWRFPAFDGEPMQLEDRAFVLRE